MKNKISNISLLLLILLPTIIYFTCFSPSIGLLKQNSDLFTLVSEQNFYFLLCPIITLCIMPLNFIAQKIDPKRKNHKKFLSVIKIIYISVLCVINITYVLLALWLYNIIQFNITKLIFIVIGLMLVIVGNYLPKIKQNSIYGIKTPWTLKSQYSWNKTHTLSGFLFVLMGILLIAISLFSSLELLILINISIIFIVIIAIFIASYLYFKKEGNK